MAQLNLKTIRKISLFTVFVTALASSFSAYAQDESVITIDANKELQQEVGVPDSQIIDRENAYRPQIKKSPAIRNKVEYEAPKKNKSFEVQSDLLFGSSSNVARFEGAPAGNFMDVTPRVLWTPDLGDRIDVGFSADAFLRTFQDAGVDELFRTFSVSGTGEFTYFFGNAWFAGLDGQITQFDGRDIDFTSPTNSGRDFRFTNNRTNVLFGREFQRGFLEFSLGQEWLRAETTVLDEAGNQFLTDFNQTQAGVRFDKQFTDRMGLQLSYNLRFREFLDQRARLTTGQVDPNFFDADRLEEIEHSIAVLGRLRPVEVELTYDYVGDLIAGAENRYSFGGVVAVPFEPFSFLMVRPEAGIRNTLYESFIGALFTNANATDERNDILSFVGVEMVIDTGLLKPVITARHTELTSNFSIIQFEEDTISGGIRLQF